jgi:hypothetical protein
MDVCYLARVCGFDEWWERARGVSDLSERVLVPQQGWRAGLAIRVWGWPHVTLSSGQLYRAASIHAQLPKHHREVRREDEAHSIVQADPDSRMLDYSLTARACSRCMEPP